MVDMNTAWTMPQVADCVLSIVPVSDELSPRIRARIEALLHPPGSLGRLEECVERYALMRQTVEPVLEKQRICIFAADHGVADENLSTGPKSVTPAVVRAMLAGNAGVSVLSRHAGIETQVIDVGVDYEFAAGSMLVDRKICNGSANLRYGPAMSCRQAEQALAVGIEMANQAAQQGIDLLGTGEMGIANTTPSAALFSVWLGLPVEKMVGRGSGIDDKQFAHKQRVLNEALCNNQQWLEHPLSTLAAVGGLEIAALAGLCLGAAARRIPVVIDGFIASAAALAAIQFAPGVKDYLFFSHCSAEQGHRVFLEKIGAQPLLDLGLRLGEGTGAALAMNIVQASVKAYREMTTFEALGIEI